ncbi:hypothetical protein IC620_09530 [Hazenella sp. IB182357]|uniref:Phage tail protein n=1 Tax=Polycladospora coralii TaxID=2771432 RepID=A0A926NFH9_9BACL|nr:hypothetical protein [Polycladospora coralii]MBD1372594.1 hypothetical protein [Polycladospora coralii]
MATLQDQTVHTGASILLMIAKDGEYHVVGRATGIEAKRSFGTKSVDEIGSIMPAEHVYTKYEGTLTINRFFVEKKTLVDLGFAALGEEVLKMNLLDVVVVSKKYNSIIRAYRGCSIQDYSEKFNVDAIAGEDATFVYLKASDATN